MLALSFALPAVIAAPALRAQSGVDFSSCGLEPGPELAVAAVIDGDTVRLADGKVVRLVGILAPRALDVGASPGGWPPELEARRALSALVLGESVALAFAGPRTDRHDRVLAHLVLTKHQSQMWVQRELVRAGQARVHIAPGAEACIDMLLADEAVARAGRTGLWDNAAYQVRLADRPSELERYRWTYQLVLGRIVKLGGARAAGMAEFESSEPAPIAGSGRRKPQFRVTWKRAAAAAPATRMDTPEPVSLQSGMDVLVRGWIAGRTGPEIELLSSLQIEAQSPGGPGDAASLSGNKTRPAGDPPGAKQN